MKVENLTARMSRMGFGEIGPDVTPTLSGQLYRALDAWMADVNQSLDHGKDWIVLRSAAHYQGICDLLEEAQG